MGFCPPTKPPLIKGKYKGGKEPQYLVLSLKNFFFLFQKSAIQQPLKELSVKNKNSSSELLLMDYKVNYAIK